MDLSQVISLGTGAIGSIVSGGVTGLLGVGLQRFFDWLHVKAEISRDKLRYDHELAMRDKDAAIMREEWSGRLRVADREGQTKENVSANEAFAASLLKEPERYSSTTVLTKNQNWLLVFLDTLRGSIRPLLTLYLCVLVSYIWWDVKQLIGGEDLDPDQALLIWRLAVETILYVWTTVTLWWFGTRNQQKPPSSHGARR